MFRKPFILAVILTIIAAVSAFAEWPDGKREGFQLGLHGLYGSTTFSNGDTQSGSSVGGGVFIGYGISEQASVSFRVRYAGTNADGYEHNTVIWSADLCYFLNQLAGLFLNVGVGPVLNSPEFGDPLTGLGLYFGAGWEFIKHFSIGADLTFASVGNDNIDLTATAIVVYLKALAY